jgi:hypothetical protein
MTDLALDLAVSATAVGAVADWIVGPDGGLFGDEDAVRARADLVGADGKLPDKVGDMRVASRATYRLVDDKGEYEYELRLQLVLEQAYDHRCGNTRCCGWFPVPAWRLDRVLHEEVRRIP